jgi:hypothetical protein
MAGTGVAFVLTVPGAVSSQCQALFGKHYDLFAGRR